LSELTDVTIGGCGTGATGQTGPPYEGDILQFNASTQEWVTEPGLWEDLRVPVTSTARQGSNDPSFSRFRTNGAGSQGVFLYYFSSTVEEELYFTVQLPHSYDEGTNLEPHVHFICSTTGATGTVVWGLEYTWSNVLEVFGNTTLITGTATVGPTDTNRHLICELPTMDGTGKKLSSMIICRVYRASTSPSDTLNTEAGLMEIDFHYKMCGMGSTQEYVK
jgi:hypothetical protein